MYGFFSSRSFYVLPSVFAAVFIFIVSLVCSGCYTVKQGTTMLGYLGRAVPVESLASGEGLNAEQNRLFAERVADIRRFATEELGLKESKNYTRYVELDRNYLAAVVSASAKDSFTPYEWWFPVIGKVPYKGFFDVVDARRERIKLERKNLDVWISGVDAFSTLGWFKDPLYSYMKEYPVWELAELIIHELLHATIYVENQSKFNEGLAQFVGMEGTQLYMAKTGADMQADKDRREAAREDSAAFISFIRGLISELQSIYENPSLSSEEKLRLKAEIIEASKAHFDEIYDDTFSTKRYKGFSSMQVNNAYLEHFRLYHEEDTWFMNTYEKSGRDLKAYIAAAKTLNDEKKAARLDPWSKLETALGIGSISK